VPKRIPCAELRDPLRALARDTRIVGFDLAEGTSSGHRHRDHVVPRRPHARRAPRAGSAVALGGLRPGRPRGGL